MAELDWAKLGVLIIDDDPLIRDLIKAYLNQFGVRALHLAENGEAALESLKEVARLPDLIISDMQMPVMNGLEFTSKLRAAEYRAVREIPIMVCSTKGKQEVVEEAVRLGVDGFIVKPIEPKSMYNRIEAVLLKKQARTRS